MERFQHQVASSTTELIQAVHTTLSQEIQRVELKVDTGISELKAQFASVLNELNEFKRQMHQNNTEVAKISQ
eukprot:11430632-Karenia_brevis.AAC.1